MCNASFESDNVETRNDILTYGENGVCGAKKVGGHRNIQCNCAAAASKIPSQVVVCHVAKIAQNYLRSSAHCTLQPYPTLDKKLFVIGVQAHAHPLWLRSSTENKSTFLGKKKYHRKW